jgi:uncharacterized protein YjiS (DUF1127 family)
MPSSLSHAPLGIQHSPLPVAVQTRAGLRAAAHFMAIAARTAGSWLERRRQLRALAALDDHLLRDIGLSREDVKREDVKHACATLLWIDHG